jgi:hypothetical protein
VQQLTVYRHFSDEAAILRACTQHWLAQHPRPSPRPRGKVHRLGARALRRRYGRSRVASSRAVEPKTGLSAVAAAAMGANENGQRGRGEKPVTLWCCESEV